MPLLKSAQVPTSIAPFSLASIEAQAKGMLRAAQTKAGELLTVAQSEAEMLKREGHATGLAEGKKQGLAEGLEAGKKSGHEQALAEFREKFTTAVAALSKAAQQFDASRGEMNANGQRSLIELAAAIARRVTKRQAMLDPAVLSANLQGAMKLVSHWTDVRIAVHPNQMATLQAEMPNLKMSWPQLQHVQLIEDKTLAIGGCRVFTVNGMVDGDLDSQLDRVIEQLLPLDTAALETKV
jgi:flagellar assembly protein FliH